MSIVPGHWPAPPPMLAQAYAGGMWMSPMLADAMSEGRAERQRILAYEQALHDGTDPFNILMSGVTGLDAQNYERGSSLTTLLNDWSAE
jgi:hypothetical protein